MNLDCELFPGSLHLHCTLQEIPEEVHSSLCTSIGQLSDDLLAKHDNSGRVRLFVHTLHSLHCGVKTEKTQTVLKFMIDGHRIVCSYLASYFLF